MNEALRRGASHRGSTAAEQLDRHDRQRERGVGRRGEDRGEAHARAEREREAERAREHAAERGADEEQRRHLAAEEARAQGDAVKSSFSAKA
jgi:hypothetical protein